MFVEETAEVHMDKVRCTNMKTSRRVYFPPGRPAKEEAGIETRLQIWRDIVRRYREESCNKDGTQKTKQLTHQQMVGRSKILKRVRKAEIVIRTARTLSLQMMILRACPGWPSQ